MRVLLAALSLSAAVTGGWATFAPRSFYGDFPGAGHHWVSLLPAYNAHLISDVGAFYLAFALLFAWAAAKPARELIVPVATAFALFSAIHLGWHATHLDGFPTSDAVAQTISLAAVLIGSLAAAVLAR